MKDVAGLFGSMVFNDNIMKARLPRDIYRALSRTIETGKHLDLDVANAVANAMKDWAVEKGVTHFTHWFQPMTGITAEKHDSFISPTAQGNIILEFSGRELIRGESDASSFPSGGLRATFEARGYTAWDPTSYAFIKDNTLCIPTAFCSYSGEALDKKTPLLRSMQVLDTQAQRIMHLFGNTEVKRVIANTGAEQEYFLISKEVYDKRWDLINCGRTLFGAKPPKAQEMDDHYFGALKTRVAEFMSELDEELWKLGVLAKTKHNEAAPGQHELAPIYTTTNVATDHNQLTMELMKRIANKHNLACLLHEKPFAGVNGSGKHNNWSLATDTGINLLEPGDTPSHNARFLLFLTAVIKAVDEYQDLLRLSVASAGNDHRLGANEAPPAIVSMFLGDELTEILEAMVNGLEYEDKVKSNMEIGVTVLPHIPKDTTDRNRTSPLAFTGNKFEFRMVGAPLSIAGPNIVLNTIVAEVLCQFADALEKSENFTKDLNKLVKTTIKKHKRVIFNGNSYSAEWVKEAEKRGLSNLKTTADALPRFIEKKNIQVFTKHQVFQETEIHSRYEILMEGYCKTIHIEALTMLDMAKKQIVSSVLKYENMIAQTANHKRAMNKLLTCTMEEVLLEQISMLSAQFYTELLFLERVLQEEKKEAEILESAKYCEETLLPAMNALRETVDHLETMVSEEYWGYPTYSEIFYSVK